MSDENKKPDPIEDVRKGLGLLFRAAKNAVSELPTGKVEEVVETGLREVGRAVENVVHTIGREVFKEGATAPKTEPEKTEPQKIDPAAAANAEPAKTDEPKHEAKPEHAGDAGNAGDHVRIDKS